MNYEACACDDSTRTLPAQATLDRIADQQLSAGFDVRKTNKCATCNTFRSVNNSCLCSY